MVRSIDIQLEIAIPSQVVHFSVLGYGGSFNGGIKCTPRVKIDLDAVGSGSLSFPTPSWGITRSYDDSNTLPIAGKPDWFRSLKSGAKPLQEMQLVRTLANLNAVFVTPPNSTHGVRFTVIGSNPLIALAPPINADITIGLRKNGSAIQYQVSGDHDGFPNYRLMLNGAEIYAHDCVASDESPSALKPPMDYSVSLDWRAL